MKIQSYNCSLLFCLHFVFLAHFQHFCKFSPKNQSNVISILVFFCDPLRSGEPNKWLIASIAPTLLCKAWLFLFSWLYETSLRRLKIKKPASKMKWALFVIRSGFEPETFALEGRCSIQLSQRTNQLKLIISFN